MIQNNSKWYDIETKRPFGESLIWQLNRDYYDDMGLKAWREGEVPHNLTSNAMVGKTYAELIFAFLKDLSAKGQTEEKVYILELGVGHGRLAFHILKHLEGLAEQAGLKLPPYCYVLSDIVEDNLKFFYQHPQFQPYYENGVLDLTYFDAIEGTEITLRHSGLKIFPQTLNQPLLVIANYFFDSISNDLFLFKNEKVYECWVALETDNDPAEMDIVTLLKEVHLRYSKRPLKAPFYEETILNEILEEYEHQVFNTYLFFPQKGMQCLDNLKQLSKEGLMLITMDKGAHEIHDLENAKKPNMVTHGSMSFSVNYHAIGSFCKKQGGIAYFPTYSNFNLELGCLLFLKENKSYTETKAAYHRVVDGFGPDDFNSLKKMSYKNHDNMNLPELISMLRLGAYDSTLFVNSLARFKELSYEVTFNERTRLAQAIHQTWNMYFTLNEREDLAFEMGGILYQLGFYQDALQYFQYSTNLFGHTADGLYNRALCHYQLREDKQFSEIVKEAKIFFPDYEQFRHLSGLDLGAK